MTSRTLMLRLALRAGTAASAIALGAAGIGGAAAATPSYPSAGTVAAGSSGNPYSPAAGHPYRHGVLPTRARQRTMARWASRHPAPAASRDDLSYGGGVHGNGVTSGHEKVYLVFWGSQWGTPGTNTRGDLTLAGDQSGEAPYLQELFKGLGTGAERWSGVMTQYCDGVTYNAISCPANSYHVAYPSGGALAGVWADESAASPVQSTGHQLGVVAIAAAHHFGNNTKASNRYAQYVILSPTGTHPDGFNTPSGQFCAWHDDTADPNLPSGPVTSSLDVAFTNMPYVTDAGSSCGENFVNAGAPGVLDGASIVEGHEYGETITDQYPAFGWTNTYTGGAENGDLCAWNPPDTTGGTNNLTLPTGTFAMQSTWSNNAGGGSCSFGQRVIANNWVLNGGFEAGTPKHWTTSGSVTVVRSAHSGKYAARLGKPTPTKGSSSIAQTFTAHGTALSLWYNVNCPDTVSVAWARATLTDNTAHSSATLVAKTCVRASGWRQVKATVIAGHSYTLKLVSHDDDDAKKGDGASLRVDDVVNR